MPVYIMMNGIWQWKTFKLHSCYNPIYIRMDMRTRAKSMQLIERDTLGMDLWYLEDTLNTAVQHA